MGVLVATKAGQIGGNLQVVLRCSVCHALEGEDGRWSGLSGIAIGGGLPVVIGEFRSFRTKRGGTSPFSYKRGSPSSRIEGYSDIAARAKVGQALGTLPALKDRTFRAK